MVLGCGATELRETGVKEGLGGFKIRASVQKGTNFGYDVTSDTIR